MEFKGTRDWIVSKHERDSSGRSCYRINEEVKVTTDQREANAKLIAAAPKLLHRLMATNEVLRDLIDNGTLPEEDEAIINRNLEAINKALGQ